jgi:hypothetical protein
LSAKDLELFEKIVNLPEDTSDEDAAKDVAVLTKALDNDKTKTALMKIFSVDQLAVLGQIMNRAKDAGGKKRKRSSKKKR